MINFASLESWVFRGVVLLLICSGLLFALELILGLQWRMQHDTPLLHYVALLIDRYDYVPYRDIYETSMVGVFFFHLLVGKLFGYGDVAFRIVDAVVLLSITGIAWAALHRLGSRVALLAALLFGLYYFSKGPTMSLQRDYLAILPIVASILIAGRAGRHAKLGAAAIGALLAFAALIKPQLAIGLPVILVYLASEAADSAPQPTRRLSSFIVLAGLAGTAFALVVGLACLWLWQVGALPAFVELFSRYLPLHLQLSGAHEIIAPADRLPHLVQSWLGHVVRYAPFMLFGLYCAWSRTDADNRKRRLVLVLAGLAAAYSLTPVLAGQFWGYHWIPFDFFAVLCATLSVGMIDHRMAPLWKRVAAFLSVGIVVGYVTLKSLTFFADQLSGRLPTPPNGGRADEIAQFLNSADLGPDDRVQPLDWTGGGVHAMLLSEARPATRFIHNYHFYHHAADPYIEALRSEFVTSLIASPPRFILEITASPRPFGPGTTNEFPALDQFISRNYRAAQRGDAYTIYERLAGQ